MNFCARMAAVCGLVTMVHALPAASYHVSTNGSDANSGTVGRPWRTVQKAVNSARPGDSIFLGPGIYAEEVIWARAAVGTKEAPITLNGQGDATVHRLVLSKPHWQIINLRISGYDVQFEAHVKLENGAHYITFSNNVVDPAGALYQMGIELSTSGKGPFDANWPSHCVFIRNVITGVRARAALVLSGRNNLFTENYVTNVIQADMIRLFGENNIIRANLFSNNIPEAGVGYHPDFVQTFGVNGKGSRGHLIERNIVVDCPTQISQLVEGTGRQPVLIGTGAVGDWTFRNNVFANFKLGASVTIPNTKWYNNVFYKCNYTGGHVLNFGHGDRGTAAGSRVFNNVFFECGLQDRPNSGWYGVNSAYKDQQFGFNFVAKGDFSPVRQDKKASGYRWFEPNGINGGDPKFVDAAKYDFRLQPDSPLIGRGTPIAEFSEDLLGRPRNGAWDIGAFQSVEQKTNHVPVAPKSSDKVSPRP